MTINIVKLGNTRTADDLFDNLDSFGQSTITGLVDKVSVSLSGDIILSGYFQLSNFKAKAGELFQRMTSAEIDAAHQKRTGVTTGINADLLQLNTAIINYKNLVEAGVSNNIFPPALSSNHYHVGDITTAQRDEFLTSLNVIKAMFSYI